MSAWPVVALGSKVRFLSGGTPRKDEAKYWNGDIPWVGSAEMAQRRISDTELRVTEEGAREGSKLVPANTVLVVVRGMSLAKEFRVAITERELTFNQDLKALEPGDDLDSLFVRPAWARSWRCKSSRELTTASEVKRNCVRVTERGEEGWSETASRGTRNAYEAAPGRASGQMIAKLLWSRSRRRRCGDCAGKDCVLTWGDLASWLKGRPG